MAGREKISLLCVSRRGERGSSWACRFWKGMQNFGGSCNIVGQGRTWCCVCIQPTCPHTQLDEFESALDWHHNNRVPHNFLKDRNPSPESSPLYTRVTLALGGRAMKSMSVSPVMLPEEWFPTEVRRPLDWCRT